MVPEVAFLGRSNAGKSSLINAWAGSQIAKTSATPGKTRLINFFVGQGYRMVDFPGYGYSARSGDEQATWSGMIESFLGSRGNLCGAILVMDCRREWSEDEVMLSKFLQRCGKPMAVVLTKVDKLNRNEETKCRAAMAKLQESGSISAAFLVSNTKKSGIVELEEFVFDQWVKGAK